MVINKALYGLKTSGKRYHERFADTVRNDGFTPCRAHTDVWIRRNGKVYEYIAVYVDDLLLIMKNPREYLDILVNVHKYKLKGDEPLSFNLGCDFGRDPDGTLYYKPKKYIQKMVSTYEKMFPGETLKKQSSPLPSGDHPELDETDFLDEEGIAKYMSMIGAAQWLVTFGRLM